MSAPLEEPALSAPGIRRSDARWAAGLCLLMVIYGAVWEGLVDPIREGSWLWLKVVPLAIALPGLLNGRVYTFQWMSLLIWLYVCEALVRIIGLQWLERALAAGWLLLGLALTGVILQSIRRYKRQQPPKPDLP
ncbi:MAG: hypothetical protein RL258_822 [Pseudomonadota bacterium]